MKDSLYGELQQVLDKSPKDCMKMLLGDFIFDRWKAAFMCT
jgi:hypothetical protein